MLLHKNQNITGSAIVESVIIITDLKSHKLKYNEIDRQFYIIHNNKSYKAIILDKYKLQYLFSTPDNTYHPIWTISKIFKYRLFSSNITIYWRPFYDNMLVKGYINNNVFIIDYDLYIKTCDKLYNK